MWTEWEVFDGAVFVNDTETFFNSMDTLSDIGVNFQVWNFSEFLCELLEGEKYG